MNSSKENTKKRNMINNENLNHYQPPKKKIKLCLNKKNKKIKILRESYNLNAEKLCVTDIGSVDNKKKTPSRESSVTSTSSNKSSTSTSSSSSIISTSSTTSKSSTSSSSSITSTLSISSNGSTSSTTSTSSCSSNTSTSSTSSVSSITSSSTSSNESTSSNTSTSLNALSEKSESISNSWSDYNHQFIRPHVTRDHIKKACVRISKKENNFNFICICGEIMIKKVDTKDIRTCDYCEQVINMNEKHLGCNTDNEELIKKYHGYHADDLNKPIQETNAGYDVCFKCVSNQFFHMNHKIGLQYFNEDITINELDKEIIDHLTKQC